MPDVNNKDKIIRITNLRTLLLKSRNYRIFAYGKETKFWWSQSTAYSFKFWCVLLLILSFRSKAQMWLSMTDRIRTLMIRIVWYIFSSAAIVAWLDMNHPISKPKIKALGLQSIKRPKPVENLCGVGWSIHGSCLCLTSH